jgi:hypothetical protein
MVEHESDGLANWQVGHVTTDGKVSVLKESSYLASLVTTDPKNLADAAPDVENTIVCFLLNQHGKIGQALVMPCESLENQNIDRAQGILAQYYPNCTVGIQGSLHETRKRVRESMKQSS